MMVAPPFPRFVREDGPSDCPTLRDARCVATRRFYDFVVFTEEKKVEKLRYTHRNPVKRGLVLEPGRWPWSSFCDYAEDRHGPVLVNERQKAEMRVRVIS